MPLAPQEAFRIGFLLRCADEGLAPAEVSKCIEKAAGLMDGAMSGLSTLGTMGAVAGIAAPIALGAGAGYMAHKSVEDTIDEDDVKKQELIAELRHWARRAREQKKTRLVLSPTH